MKTMRRLVMLAIAAGSWNAARVHGGDPGEPEAPVVRELHQVEYGASPVVEIAWRNAELYEVVEVLVDGEVVASVDGASESHSIASAISPGEHSFGVRGVAAGRVTPPAERPFVVLKTTPVLDPVADVRCEFHAAEGGRLSLAWELGTSPWVEGIAVLEGSRETHPIASGARELQIALVGSALPEVLLRFRDGDGYFSEAIRPPCTQVLPLLRRGDCDGDAVATISDAVFELDHLFRGGQRWYCDDACDANDDGATNLSDPIFLLRHLFLAAPPPPDPVDDCGEDPSPDFLGGVCVCP